MRVNHETLMRVVSVNVGFPRQVRWREKTVSTGIFKQPAAGRVAIHRLNLDGDRQADLSVHGGAEKAVYAYPLAHYAYWRQELPGVELPWGMFGENLTVDGLLEDAVRIGDRFRIGSAVLAVTQPRFPCYKLGIRFGNDAFVPRFLATGLTGFYFAVVEEGEAAAGDSITCVERSEHDITVADIVRLYKSEHDDPEALTRAAQLEPLAERLRSHFARRAAQIGRQSQE